MACPVHKVTNVLEAAFINGRPQAWLHRCDFCDYTALQTLRRERSKPQGKQKPLVKIQSYYRTIVLVEAGDTRTTESLAGFSIVKATEEDLTHGDL